MAASRLMSSALESSFLPLPGVKPRALIVVADGSEDMEVLTLSDILTRGGIHVILASVGRKRLNVIEGNFGLKIKAEQSIEDCSYSMYDLLVLPGGSSASQLRDCMLLTKMLHRQKESGLWIAASSNAPGMILKAHGLLERPATGHPSTKKYMSLEYVEKDVVVNGRIITSAGLGISIKFSLKLVELLCGECVADNVAKDVGYLFQGPMAAFCLEE